jgi:hypothetical protein
LRIIRQLFKNLNSRVPHIDINFKASQTGYLLGVLVGRKRAVNLFGGLLFLLVFHVLFEGIAKKEAKKCEEFKKMQFRRSCDNRHGSGAELWSTQHNGGVKARTSPSPPAGVGRSFMRGLVRLPFFG